MQSVKTFMIKPMVCMRYFCYYLLAVLLYYPSLAYAADMVTIEVSKRSETIIINSDNLKPYKAFLLPKPDRLVVDVPSLSTKYTIALTDSYKGTLISNIRFGQFNPQTSRFVFELSGPVVVKKTSEEDGRLAIEIASPHIKESVKEKREPRDKRITTPSKKPSAKPIIVLDPGHGGQDPGASGPGGSQEKDVVLVYAKSLKAALQKTGRYQVILTRDEDEYVALRKRVEIARKAGADIFISLHADSASDLAARGLSVYTLSQNASDKESEALAARENKSDVLFGMDLSDESKEVANILISLAERDTKNRSATLADIVVTKLDDEINLLNNSHRFAGFAVLKAPDIPSVLVEIGFLSHPSEEKLIQTKSYRDKVVSGLVESVDHYFVMQNRLGGQ
jgi:N-acetylmuramoyl-L-alanine amidase